MPVSACQDILRKDTPQTLKYYFCDGRQAQQEKVDEAIKEWAWYANVDCEKVDEKEDSNMRIEFGEDEGSWSCSGNMNDDIPHSYRTMNLSWLDPMSGKLEQGERSSILHQFGNVLGLLHECQSPAHNGDTSVVNVQAAIDLYQKPTGFSVHQVQEQIVNAYATCNVSKFSQVDTQSTMHMPMPKELEGLPKGVPNTMQLSDSDEAYMIIQYPRSKMHQEAVKKGWSFEKALQVIGASEDVTKQILGFIKTDVSEDGEISPTNIRNELEKSSRATHADRDARQTGGLAIGRQ